MATKRTDEEYIDAAKKATSMKNLLDILELKTFNYKSVRNRLKRLNISTDHWIKANFQFKRGHSLNYKPILEQLIEYAPNLKAAVIRKKLIKENYLSYECSSCKINEWNNKELTLHLDHINGINTDYRFENLRLLCPNCHSQTDTYCGRNNKSNNPERRCKCGNKILFDSKTCIKCSGKTREKIDWPSIDLIIEEVKNTSYTAVGNKLGVSDNAVRKYLIRKGCEIPKFHNK